MMLGELPKGWKKERLSEVAKLLGGFAFKSSDYTTKEDGIPIIRMGNLSKEFKLKWNPSKQVYFPNNKFGEVSKYVLFENDLLICLTDLSDSGDYLGTVALMDDNVPALLNQRVSKFLLDVEKIEKRFLYYQLCSPLFRKYMVSDSTGTLQKNTNHDYILNFKINIPPLPEQERIVAKLDSLFAHLEETKKRLEKIPELLKQFRQAVLTQAVTGKLTEEWRKGKGLEDVDVFLKRLKTKRFEKIEKKDDKRTDFANVEIFEIPKTWKWVRLWDLSYLITSGSRDWSQYYSEKGAHFVRSAEINNNKLRLEDTIFVDLPAKVEGKRSLIQKGDLLVTITGANVGKCAKITEQIPEAYVSQSVALIKLVDFGILDYIHINMLSPASGGGMLEELSYGMGRPVLSLPQIKSVQIPFPPKDEQTEIVRRVESLFAKADTIEAQYKKLKEQIDQLPQAILAKAFRGEV